jgi:hypothetical protein
MENLKDRCSLEDLGIDGRITGKSIPEIRMERVWSGLVYVPVAVCCENVLGCAINSLISRDADGV